MTAQRARQFCFTDNDPGLLSGIKRILRGDRRGSGSNTVRTRRIEVVDSGSNLPGKNAVEPPAELRQAGTGE